MKIIITENKIDKVLKQSGVERTIKLLGGLDNFRKVYNIENPMDLLNLYNVKQVESDDKILYMVDGDVAFTYNKKDKGPVMSHQVSGLLHSVFGISYNECEDIFDKWFSKKFNLEVDFNRKDWVRNYLKNQKSKIKTYNQFFGIKKPKNWGKGDGITVDTIKDQIVEDLTDGYDLSDINKDVLKHNVDKFAQKWFNMVRNLDYDSAIDRTIYINETDEWDEFLSEIGL